MAFYRTCPKCGANLDPGETCECQMERVLAEKKQEKKSMELLKLCVVEQDGQLRLAV